MTIEDLKEQLKDKDILHIEFEDYSGNTIFSLESLDIADVEEHILRLQLNRELD